ncbi:MAG: Xaa-Pro dipeptidase [Dethiosulfovibrio peptidovorans]|nr:MAG: Xaa-Pro dipeptidase [Dethiosulfovibrio peptidovorans]
MAFDHLWNRLDRLRDEMLRHTVDGVLFLSVESFGIENLFYFSGFRGSSAALLITQKDAVLATDGRYVAQAAAQSPFRIVPHGKKQTLLDMVGELLRRCGVTRCGFEGDAVTYSVYQRLSKLSATLQDMKGAVSLLRRPKDNVEVALITKTCRIAAAAYDRTLREIRPGMTELEIAKRLEAHIVSLGGEGGWPRSPFIVASGVRSAMPHGVASTKQVCEGEWVTVDFGASCEGYMSDLTRNFALGYVSDPEFLKIHDILQESHAQGAQAIVPGSSCLEVDQAARKVIQEAGYGQYFSHGLGHGLGVEIHESPRLSPRSVDSLAVGDVVTIEPGIYIPDRGGLRIEDDYLVTEDGAVRLSEGLSQDFRILAV